MKFRNAKVVRGASVVIATKCRGTREAPAYDVTKKVYSGLGYTEIDGMRSCNLETFTGTKAKHSEEANLYFTISLPPLLVKKKNFNWQVVKLGFTKEKRYRVTMCVRYHLH